MKAYAVVNSYNERPIMYFLEQEHANLYKYNYDDTGDGYYIDEIEVLETDFDTYELNRLKDEIYILEKITEEERIKIGVQETYERKLRQHESIYVDKKEE